MMEKIRDHKSVAKVVKMKAMGYTDAYVGRKMGVTRQAVWYLRTREDIQELIDTENKRFLESLPEAVDNIKFLIKDFRDEIGKENPNKQKVEYGFKGSVKALESAGIAPGVSSSVMIQNVFNQQNLISPLIDGVLDKYLEGVTVPVIEGSIEGEEVKDVGCEEQTEESQKREEIVDRLGEGNTPVGRG